MSTRNRILIHGGLAAMALALLGWMMAEVAGQWIAGQASHDAAEQGEAVAARIRRTLPLTLAAGGFLFVLLGELLLGLWRKK